MPLGDAGALADPLILGLEEFDEIGVGDDLFRQETTGPGDSRVFQHALVIPRYFFE